MSETVQKISVTKKLNEKLHSSSLEARWEKTALIAVLVFIVIFSVALTVIVNMFYTNAVRERINSLHTDTVDAYFQSYTSSESSFTNGAIEFTNNFRYSDKMEVWIISAAGRPLVSSSGLLIDNSVDMPDYEMALNSEDGRGEWKGKMNGSDTVMAVTNIINNENGERIGAIRYITSLNKLNTQVFLIMLSVIFMIVAAAALLFSFNKSFIRSVAAPIKELKNTAASIAKGDFSVHPEYDREDEIGELYDSMSYMATELGRIDKMKSDFITTVSHELRTPLTAIEGWGETLLNEKTFDPETNRKGLTVIVSESNRLTGLVEELLDFSRIQQDSFFMKNEPVDLLTELEVTALVFSDTAKREGKNFQYDAPEIPAMSKGDADRLKQAFFNVIGNAIKYTEPGGTIDIHANIVEDELIIFVRDTGCGISEEDLPRVKEKFFKANDRVHGNGIGLAVADEIITRHGGTLDIKSKLGEGTIVKITLPLGVD